MLNFMLKCRGFRELRAHFRVVKLKNSQSIWDRKLLKGKREKQRDSGHFPSHPNEDPFIYSPFYNIEYEKKVHILGGQPGE